MKNSILASVCLTLIACQSPSIENDVSLNEDSHVVNHKVSEINQNTSRNIDHRIMGNYVTEGYYNRDEGYDWFAISIQPAGEKAIHISVRSRIDIKKPTCTLDTTAYKVESDNDMNNEEISRYQMLIDDAPIFLRFNQGELLIDGETEDLYKTGYFCSGGAMLGGLYHKVNGKLDTQQLDKF